MDNEIGNQSSPDYPTVPGLEIVDLLASGSHGSVFLARQLSHERFVALKVLQEGSVDDEARHRFDLERVALGRISDHPAVVPLIDSGYTDTGLPFIVLEYEPGGSLAEHLTSGGPMMLDEATEMIIELAAAIECSHNAGIIHRDIKPANIIKSAYGKWMITDFGVASIIDRSNTGTIHVSYAHTAPESLEGAGPTSSNDVYSLASVLATALTDIEPFEMTPGESPGSVMQRIATEPYPDLRRSYLPDDLATLLEMALSKEPAQRPVSARSFAAAVNEIRLRHELPKVPIQTGHEIGSGMTSEIPTQQRASLDEPSWRQTQSGATDSQWSFRMVVASIVFGLFVGAGLASFAGLVDGPVELAAQVVGIDGPDGGQVGGPGEGRGNGGPGGGGPGGNR